jgi:hypothetical protein
MEMCDEQLILQRFRDALKDGECFGPVAASEIIAAEQALGVRFPLSYRVFHVNLAQLASMASRLTDCRVVGTLIPSPLIVVTLSTEQR